MTSPHLTAKQHRALAMLATAGRDGATQASLDAHGFDASLVVGLLNCGLATTMYERVPPGGETVEVTINQYISKRTFLDMTRRI